MLNIRGRLGNQIIQLNFYLSKKKHHPTINDPLSNLDSIFKDLNLNKTRNTGIYILFKILRKVISTLKNKYSDLILFGVYDGYFQKEVNLDSNLREYLNERVIKTPMAKLAIHCRGEDYLSKRNVNIYHIIRPVTIVKLINSKNFHLPKVVYLVGNDNSYLEQIQQYLDMNFKATTFKIFQGKSAWEDFSFLSNAESCITSNSTFSFCARLLNTNKKTYCPKTWFKKEYYSTPYHVNFEYFDNI